MANVVLVPIGRIPIAVNNIDLKGCEDIQGSHDTPTTFHAGPGFTDFTAGRPQERLTLTFALFSQLQEFDAAIANVPTVNGARRFDFSYKLGTQSYLVKKCQVTNETFSSNEVSGDARLTRNLVGAERVPLSIT
jgi:hypothetical protein